MTLPFSIRQAVRSLFRYPTVSVLSVVALALGIGLPTAMFSIVDASILRGLPIADPAHLMHLERWRAGTSGEGIGAAPRDFLAWSAQQHSFSAFAAVRTGTATLRDRASVNRVESAWLTPGAFALLGVPAAVGRTFGESDMRADATPSVVLSWNVWRDQFAGATSVLGQTVMVDGIAHTVIGVMPKTFRFPFGQDMWLPMTITQAVAADTTAATLDVFGLLKPSVSRNSAKAEFALIAARTAEMYPATNRGYEITIKPFAERFLGETATATMYVMLGAVLLVLLVACANVANLLFVRAVHRARDIAIYLALGASRSRIVGQVMLESAMLALAGGILGLFIAQGAVAFLARRLAGFLPYWANPTIDAKVVLFAFVLVLTAMMLAGVGPALKTTASNLSITLRDDSRGSTSGGASRVMQSLVVLELTLSMALLVTMGLLTQGARHAERVDLGFATRALITARVSLPETRTLDERTQYYAALEARLKADPSVNAVAFVSTLPGAHAPYTRIAIDGLSYVSRDAMPAVRSAAASSSFFTALGVRATRGRLINEQDVRASEAVMVVNERFVEKFLKGAEAVGQRVRMGSTPDAPLRTIVGVVPNLWMGAFDASPDRNPAGYYVPISQSSASSVAVVVQARGDATGAALDAMRVAAFSVDADVPLYEIRDMPTVIQEGTWFYEFFARILIACGVSALFLATIGVYGVIAFSVSRRKREFGVRLALGATSRSIVQLVLRRGTLQIALGLSFGIVLALALSRGVASLLFDGSATDIGVYAFVATTLAVIAAAAMLVPALAASRTEPLEALRGE
jgi:putative ABC transport system permease protein